MTNIEGAEQSTLRVQKVNRKWLVTGANPGWISKRQFPRKWKAELAIEIYRRGGRVSDYFAAMRDQREERAASRSDVIERARQDAIRRFGSDAAAALSTETVITIVRHSGHDGLARVPLNSLSDFHIRDESGGIARQLAWPTLCARIWCDEIPAEYRDNFGHSCAHGPGPHEIVVCIGKSHNQRATYERLLASSRV